MSLSVKIMGADGLTVDAQGAIIIAQQELQMNLLKYEQDQINAGQKASQSMANAAHDSTVAQGQQSVSNGIGQITGGAITAGSQIFGALRGLSKDPAINAAQDKVNNLESYRDALNGKSGDLVANQQLRAINVNNLSDEQREIFTAVKQGDFTKTFKGNEADINDVISVLGRDGGNNNSKQAVLKMCNDQIEEARDQLKSAQSAKSSLINDYQNYGQIGSALANGIGLMQAGTIGINNANNEANRVLAQNAAENLSNALKMTGSLYDSIEQRKQLALSTERDVAAAQYRG
jgi:hypothetical protein